MLRYFVTVAEERHFGRAAARLNMTQPPLSRGSSSSRPSSAPSCCSARRGRSRSRRPASCSTTRPARCSRAPSVCTGASPTLQPRRRSRSGRSPIPGSGRVTALLPAFARRHPDVALRVHEADFTDPTAGLRTRQVDVAVTRTPFEDDGIVVHVLRRDPVGVVLRNDDPLAGRDRVSLGELAARRWFRQPEETDLVWREWWNRATVTDGSDGAPAVRTIQEALNAVLWSGCIGLAPRTDSPARGIAVVPVSDMEPSELVVAYHEDRLTPLVRSLIEVARFGRARSARPELRAVRRVGRREVDREPAARATVRADRGRRAVARTGRPQVRPRAPGRRRPGRRRR